MANLKIQFFDGFSSETTPNTVIASGPSGDIIWRGNWTSTNFTTNDAVSYNGSSYVCHTDTTSSQDPTDTNYWDVLASKGDDGADGPTGATGPQGDAGVGIPAGGTTGQVLAKIDGDDYNTEWTSAGGSPPIDTVFGRTGDVVATTNDYTWAQVDKTTSDIADLTTKSHTSLTDIGTNTHAQIDTHIADTSNPHSVDKTDVGLSNVVNADTTTTANITDSSNKRFMTDAQEAVLDATSGTNTGDQTDISGTSGNTDALNSATTTIDVSSATAPTSGQVLTATSGTTATWQTPSGGGGGSGDVVGPASSTDGNVVTFDGTTGKLIQDSGLTLSGSNTGDQDAVDVDYTDTYVIGETDLQGAVDASVLVGIANATQLSGFSGGTSGQVLTKDSGTDYDYSWATPSGGGGSADAIINISLASTTGAFTTTYTVCPMTTEEYNSSTSDYTHTGGVITVKAAGTYEISYDISIDENTGNNRTEFRTDIYKNSSILSGTASYLYSRNNAQGAASSSCNIIKTLAANDTIEVRSKRNSGSNTGEFLADGCRLTIRKINT